MKVICTPTRTHIQSICKVFLFVCLLTITQNATATIRYVKAGATGAGTSWIDASGNLKSIIDASLPGDEVWVAAGDYKTPDNLSFVMMPGVKIYGGFVGTETSLAQRNVSLHTSRLLPYDNEVIIKNENNGLTSTALLDGFTISNATQGAVFNTSSSPSFANCTFSNNQTMYNGGAMSNNSCSPTITNCLFTQNTSSSSGGAVSNYPNSSPSFTGCTFSNNTGSSGGAVLNSTNGTPSYNNCTFTANKAPSSIGGAMHTIFSAPLITNCTFTNNTCLSTGGAIYNQPSPGALTQLSGCTFTGNTSNTSGGALYSSSTTTEIINCVFKGNSSKDGAGIYQRSRLTLINTTITGNISSNQGGGLYLEAPAAGSAIINCTIAGNTATTSGGGILNNAGSTTLIRNSVIYNNSTGITNVSSTTTINNSLVQDIADNTNGNISGAVDPQFINPVTPGLSTGGNYRLQPCSPAVDKGNNSYYTSTITTDPDGNARIYNSGIIDMGAYERTTAATVIAGGSIYICETGRHWYRTKLGLRHRQPAGRHQCSRQR